MLSSATVMMEIRHGQFDPGRLRGVSLRDGADPFGAVRRVDGPQAKDFVVYVENAGEFRVSLAAVDAVHEGKVILHRAKLEPGLQRAIGHAHEGEHEDR